jgi:predicted nuclease of restriction endonuclease-like RecB superfamily
MLPSNLLRAKISRGKIRPLYVNTDPDTLALTERISGIYRSEVGKRKAELLERLRELEDEGQFDFKLVRGLSALLERRCVFEAESVIDPTTARMAVFEEASKARASSREQRNEVIATVSTRLGVSSEILEKTLYSDLDDELILRKFDEPLGPSAAAHSLLKRYNLSLTQTLLFKSLRVEFTASGNWKNIFREVKRLGLIYSVERNTADGGRAGYYTVSLDGPLSLFKLTERYGTSIAKLLPQIITASESWKIKAEILARSKGGRVYTFEADSKELSNFLPPTDAEVFESVGEREVVAEAAAPRGKRAANPLYDSTVEEKFARSFVSYGTGWALKREPEPLLAGRHVLIPDFGFEKDGLKVYLEVVGFWTPEYLERKISKLSAVATGGEGATDMIVAADETLACSKLERLKGRGALVIYYKKDVPLKPIIDHLKEREASILKAQVEVIRKELEEKEGGGGSAIILKSDIVRLEEIAEARRVPLESIRAALHDFNPVGYVRAGDLFISKAKLEEIEGMLTGVEKLVDALEIIKASGVIREEEADGQKILDALGYTSIWEGMEIGKVRISKQKPTVSSGSDEEEKKKA